MCDPDEDTASPFAPSQHHQQQQQQQLMDLDDLDLDSSWPFDQLTFGSDPTSPLIIPSSSDRPCSPLWAFSDDDKLTSAAAGYNIFLTCATTTTATENRKEDDNRKLSSSPFLGIMPLESQDGYCVIKERMTQALRYFKESTEQQVLAQVWVPVRNGGRCVLTTSGQPFVLDPHSNGLHEYRTVSLMYTFSVDGESDVDLGLPGRVFRQKLPEWTPNVQYYSSKEYSRLDHALLYNVRGTLALPVFEPSVLSSCVGVIELILTSQKINYAPEVDKVCKALEAVNLKSSEILDHPNIQICNESRQHALAEILEILTVICETHKLPLAQTWIPCRHRSILAHGGGLKKSCSSFDGSCVGQVCMSTTDVAFYVVDAHMWGFREACAEHHLQKGQGVAGKAFLARNTCFCADITRFCKTEYPLVHYARMFGLTGCFAICLQSSHTGDDDYVLEFFLPPAISSSDEQKVLLGAILATMKQHFRSLMVASEVVADEDSIEVIQASAGERIDPVPTSMKSAPGPLASQSGREAADLNLGSQNPVVVQENKGGIKKTSERKRGKTEKSISLDVLQQYFSGSLKDAAKSLGVCPTTMKRICRQHGISRWPSRKINKVNRSLSKLKRVIESVQGTEGAFALPSLAKTSLPVGSIAWQSNLNPPTSPTVKHPEPQGDKNSSPPRQMPGNGQTLVENRSSSQEELSPHQNGFSLAKGSNSSRTGSGSREGSAGTPTSRVSYHGSPTAESASTKDPPGSSANPNTVGSSPHLAAATEPFLSSAFSIPDSLWRVDTQEPFGALLLEDAGSSKDLRNLCPAVFTQTTPRATSSSETRTLTIKASYRDDIIRFRISSNCGIVDLREEVAKRLKLEVGTFDIKYLDDDNEWVLIACDPDLLECLDISRSSSIIRLAIQDSMANLGSSCESTGEL